MAVNVRKVPALMLAALVTLANQLTADVSSLLGRAGNGVRARIPLAAIVTDLTDLRTKLAAAVVDLAVLRTPIVASLVDLQAALVRYENGTVTSGAIADGTTAGKIKTVADVTYRIKGRLYFKAATDDLWNLAALADTDGTHYRAYWLYLDTSGTASVVAGTDALTSEALAIAALPAVDTTKSVIGVYVAGPSTDFNGVSGLDSYGSYYNGWPAVYTMTAAAPAALTASAPSALSTSNTVAIADGTTAGYLKLSAGVDYSIGGTVYHKAATDDLWNLSAQTNTSGAQYRAFWLYLNSAGTASIGAGTNAASAAAAIAALPALDATKAVIGTYVAGLSTDFDGVAGLDSYGDIYNGFPGNAASDALTSEAITLVAI